MQVSAAISSWVTGSHLNSEVKQDRARVVPRWGTTREGRVLRILFLFSLPTASFCAEPSPKPPRAHSVYGLLPLFLSFFHSPVRDRENKRKKECSGSLFFFSLPTSACICAEPPPKPPRAHSVYSQLLACCFFSFCLPFTCDRQPLTKDKERKKKRDAERFSSFLFELLHYFAPCLHPSRHTRFLGYDYRRASRVLFFVYYRCLPNAF